MPRARFFETASISRAEQKDLDAICEIEHRCFLGPAAYSEDVLRGLVLADNTDCLVVRSRGRIAGFAIMVFSKESPRADIETIDVDPAFRGKGFARQLLNEIEHSARIRKIHEIELEVACNNSAALRLYQSAGFVVQARLVRYYRFLHHGTHDAFRMIKVLSPDARRHP